MQYLGYIMGAAQKRRPLLVDYLHDTGIVSCLILKLIKVNILLPN